MKKRGIILLVAAGVLVLIVAAAGLAFYVRVYAPIGSPLMAIAGAKTLEDRRLENKAEFVPPASGEVTAQQAANFAAVEEDVQKSLATGLAELEQSRADLERASDAGALSLRATLQVFRDLKSLYLNAKMAQIDAMNRSHVAKSEFEWVRKQLCAGAGARWSQLDVSEVLAGVPDATVQVRHFDADGAVPELNARLARPLAAKLQAWLPLAFFGL